jgi:hypothetical protein
VKPALIFLENVEEFRTWGPLDDAREDHQERVARRSTSGADELRRAGYKLQFRELRACDYGAPTIRKRFFMIARRDGHPTPRSTNASAGSARAAAARPTMPAAASSAARSGARVVIVDPLGVWWGLRLLADGKTPSPFNVAIFGGPHGDLPLNEHVGALIGETAATMAESCIIDLSEFGSKSADRRFMSAFLESVYRKANGDPFHLVVDEADLFAPQKPGKGDEVLLGHMENIVRRGRVKGFIPWLISQRPAVLNKNVLSQVDGLIAFMLTASQDRAALDWDQAQADEGQGKRSRASCRRCRSAPASFGSRGARSSDGQFPRS